MASRILLISTNRYTTPDPVFPLGLAHLNAALRQAGLETRWFDSQATQEPLESMLVDFRPDFVGISLRNIDDVLIRRQETFFDDLDSVCQLVRRIRGCPIILGGSGFSLFPRELLRLSGADYGIQGEGETALVALIAALEKGGPSPSIAGLVARDEDLPVARPPARAPVNGHLEAADRPADLAQHYLQQSGMLNVQTQRGCALDCCYCTYPLIEGRIHRRRAPEAVAGELEVLQASGAKYVFFVDSIFNSSSAHIGETCEAILKRKLALRWGCFMRPHGLTADLMRLMARAGLTHIEFGSDSFSDPVLEAYHKGLTFEDILESSELARQAGIDYCHFLISGGPGETLDTLQDGFQNSQRLKGAVIMAVVGMRIYPGTRLFELAVREAVISADVNLLKPTYYLAPGLTAEVLFDRLREFAQLSPNWITGDPVPSYAQLVARLRRRGVVGPLWSYFSLMQRVLPQRLA